MESRDWNAATDVVDHARPSEAIALERLTFNTGQSRFRSGSLDAKISHKARRRGKRVIRINPNGTTGTCPQCSLTGLEFDAQRVLVCACGYSGDRDYSSALIVTDRGQRSLARLRAPKKQSAGRKPQQEGPLKHSSKQHVLVMPLGTPQPETVVIPRHRTGVHRPPTRIKSRTLHRVGNGYTGPSPSGPPPDQLT
jgi:hypothetical protein